LSADDDPIVVFFILLANTLLNKTFALVFNYQIMIGIFICLIELTLESFASLFVRNPSKFQKAEMLIYFTELSVMDIFNIKYDE
jgi:hypothetical protein